MDSNYKYKYFNLSRAQIVRVIALWLCPSRSIIVQSAARVSRNQNTLPQLGGTRTNDCLRAIELCILRSKFATFYHGIFETLQMRYSFKFCLIHSIDDILVLDHRSKPA